MNDKPTGTKSVTTRYMWEPAHKEIDQYIKSVNAPELTKAWTLALRIIEAQASLYVTDVSEELAMSMAWEDFEMACRGVGQPGIGGAIFHLWSRTSRREDKKFQSVLNAAFEAARGATDPRAFRYSAHHRSTPVATLEKGFGKREVQPSALSAPHVEADFDSDFLNGAPPGKKGVIPKPPPNFKFTVLTGGKKD